ncbi:hypothetical protein AO265_03255 [Pseudomonas sp. ABAC61]|nr:hypothetical protein AO265_03255 [Pseudomonas sp. ABAC61]
MTHAAAQGTPCGTTDTGTNSSASAAAQVVADHRTTRRTQAAANGCLGTTALARSGRTAGRPRDTGTDGRPGAATELLSHHVAQRAAKTATNGRRTVTRHRPLGQQKSHNQGR